MEYAFFRSNVCAVRAREKIKDNLNTEEATKTALVMPFIQAFGYDIFNPYEMIPKIIADVVQGQV